MTRDEIAAALDQPTVDVPTAARLLGIGANLAYDLIKRDEFPCRVLRLGRRLRVPTSALCDLLGMNQDDDYEPLIT